jgi:hypothetical protein
VHRRKRWEEREKMAIFRPRNARLLAKKRRKEAGTGSPHGLR